MADQGTNVHNKNDFIRREAAYKTLTEYYHHSSGVQHTVLREALNRVPTADARPVVLCRDCKHYKESKLLGPTKFCYYYKIGAGLNTADDDFCSKGERREPNLDTTKGERRDESSG